MPNGKPGDWLKIDGDIVPCRRGLHLCRRGDLVSWLGPVIYEAEYRGEKIVADNKIVVAEARLLRQLPGWNERTARLFAADCAERALKRERKAGREPDPRSWAAVRAARAYADGEIDKTQLAAAWDAAWVAAGAAAWDAARAAAWDAAWDAARAAAWAAAGAAAWDAAGDPERRWQTKRLLEYANGTRA